MPTVPIRLLPILAATCAWAGDPCTPMAGPKGGITGRGLSTFSVADRPSPAVDRLTRAEQRWDIGPKGGDTYRGFPDGEPRREPSSNPLPDAQPAYDALSDVGPKGGDTRRGLV